MTMRLQLALTEQLENKAKEKLEKPVYDFIAGGAGTEWGLHNNRDTFSEYSIIPRVLKGVGSVDITLKLLGNTTSPILISPCAFHKLVCAKGEVATAKAAAKIGTIFTVSTMSTCSIEEIAETSFCARKWFQLYVFKDRAITEHLVRRAEKSGYEALVVTVDVPVMGMRLRDIYNKFSLPSDLDAANLRYVHLSSISGESKGSKIKEHTDEQFDANLTWDSIDWISSITKLPIILKGILSVEDALESLKHRVSAIIVSNHGARQLDTVTSPLSVLPDIAEAVKSRIPILLDGGIRTGEDIFKSLALGATAVMLGRPVLWSLAVGGEDQLVSTFSALHKELALTMRLAGCPTLEKIHQHGLSLLSSKTLMLRKIFQTLSGQSVKPEDMMVNRKNTTMFAKL